MEQEAAVEEMQNEVLKGELGRLENAMKETQAVTNETVKKSKAQDPAIEELGKWYQQMTLLMKNCLGMGEIKVVNGNVIQIQFNISRGETRQLTLVLSVPADRDELTVIAAEVSIIILISRQMNQDVACLILWKQEIIIISKPILFSSLLFSKVSIESSILLLDKKKFVN
jgi:hypothetical protein